MEKQNPFFEKRAGFSYAGYFEFDDGVPVTAAIWQDYVKYSPYELNGDWQLYKNDEKICRLEPLKSPDWYLKKVGSVPAARLVQRHGRNQLATAAWSNCALFEKGEQCKFCLIGYNKRAIQQKDPEKLAAAVSIALQENPKYALVMNGGTTYAKDRGARNYLPFLKAIKEDLPINVELAPPKGKKSLEELYSAGTNSLMMNFECFDEGMRRLICPGKTRICRREDYFSAWREGIKIFGEGMVSSVLLIGLESVESTEAGIKALVDMGVIPDLLVYRPMDNTQLSKFPRPTADNVKYLYTVLGEKLSEAGLVPEKQTGCVKCGGCSLTSLASKRFIKDKRER